MALIDKASLLMVPSTYEAGKLYNVLPSGNRAPDETGSHSGYDQTRADFDFDRGSNAAATRVNADGLIEKYRENLLLQSNQFDTTWLNANSTETSGQADKDGGTNAWKIDITGVGGRIYQSKSQSGVVTFSVYAKKGTLDWVILSSNVTDASFNLATGEKGTLVSGIDSNIEAVGETGWYRCSFTGNGSFTQFRIYPAIADNTFTASSGNIYIQDAQAETSLVATDYLDSTSVTGKAGVLIDLPRIDYSSGAGALLLEPSRQQLLQYSEYFGASYWTKTGSSVVAGFTSPEGLSNAYELVEDTSTGRHSFVFPAISTTSNNTYSIYVKSNGRTKIGFREVQETGYYAAFNLTSNAVIEKSSQVTASIVPLSNGWKRCEINFPVTSATVMGFYMLPDSYTTGDPYSSTYTGDGTSGIYIFGAQLEAGSYSTSYIPNHGTSGGVTRALDSCSVTGASDVIGQTEGTIYAEWTSTNINVGGRILAISDTTFANRIAVLEDGGDVRVYASTSSVVQADLYSLGSYTGTHKIAIAYANNDIKVYVDGASVATQSSFSVPACSAVYVGSLETAGAAPLNGGVKQALLFNERLTNEELATLTTL